MPATLELTFGALLVGGVGGVAIGAYAARRRDQPADHISRRFSLLGSSLPVFWTGLVFLSVLYARLGWFPGPGRLPARVDPPDHVTGFYTIDSLLDGNFGLFKRLPVPARAPLLRARLGVHGTDLAPRAGGDARRDQRRLRAHGTRQGSLRERG